MGLPSKPDALENKLETSTPVGRDPSYPDRARIDSDVRAFLRPASSPWIVFDRDSRVDDFAKSALRVGAVFASSPSLRQDMASSVEVISGPEPVILDTPMPTLDATPAETPISRAPIGTQPMFPVDEAPASPVLEPSNLIVAADIAERAPASPRETLASDPFAVPGLVPNRSRVLMLAGAALGIVALVGVTSLAVARPTVGAAASTAKVESKIEVKVDAPAPVAAPVAPATVSEAPAEPVAAVTPAPEPVSEPVGARSNDPKKRFGRLTIKADGKTKNVWFDGKRMLGSGTRTFMVFCGMHTVAVNEKTDAKDIEIPCNGEYVAAAK